MKETEVRSQETGVEELAAHYHQILTLLGEDPEREGLLKTPMRVAKAMQVLTRGYQMDAHKVLTDALFREDYSLPLRAPHAALLRQGPRGLHP